MNKILMAFFALIVICGASIVQADEFGTPKEAKAMAEAAAKYHNEKGLDALVKEIEAKNPQFRKKDLYVFVSYNSGKNIVHGAVPAFKGRDFHNLKDVTGVFLVREMSKLAQSKGSGWVNYKWPNPKTKKIRDKTTYVIKLTDNTWLGVGAYK